MIEIEYNNFKRIVEISWLGAEIKLGLVISFWKINDLLNSNDNKFWMLEKK